VANTGLEKRYIVAVFLSASLLIDFQQAAFCQMFGNNKLG
jgi:hypothetical protein